MTTFRAMFYMLTPSETYYERTENVPDYVTTAIQLFLGFQVLEFFVAWYQGKTTPRLDDTFSSLAAGIISRLPKLFFQSLELTAYIWIYERCNFLSHLPWNSLVTYCIAFIGIDFGYYWFHRMAHEVNLFWATHQTHHSAENYNLSTALRQGFFQSFFSWIFYLPLALIIPPQIFLIHLQMNLLFQFWLHTEVIANLGPLELIFNTPSYHRVHHGRNPYCIDKNYGGVLIVWDRLFGTFAAERQDEEIAYGLVHSFTSFNPLKIQLGHFQYMIDQFFKLKGWRNKLSLIWKGPSWQPGLPRLGDHQYPLVKYPIEFYHPKIPMFLSIYTFGHFLYVLMEYSIVLKDSKDHSSITMFIYALFLLFTLTTFGAIFDKQAYAYDLERIRLISMLLLPCLPIMKSVLVFQTHPVIRLVIFLSLVVTFLFPINVRKTHLPQE